jgi:hypothetical protein
VLDGDAASIVAMARFATVEAIMIEALVLGARALADKEFLWLVVALLALLFLVQSATT